MFGNIYIDCCMILQSEIPPWVHSKLRENLTVQPNTMACLMVHSILTEYWMALVNSLVIDLVMHLALVNNLVLSLARSRLMEMSLVLPSNLVLSLARSRLMELSLARSRLMELSLVLLSNLVCWKGWKRNLVFCWVP